MNKNKNLGNRGEEIAKAYLTKNGYSFLEKNYRAGRREIDLIFFHKDKLVFIEVKTRIKTEASKLEEPLSPKQTKNLQKAIIDYCREKRINLDRARLDLIYILIDENIRCANLKHYLDIL